MLSNCFVSVLDVSSNVAFACRNERNKKRERKVGSIRTISNWKRFDRARQRTEWPPPRENISFCLDTTFTSGHSNSNLYTSNPGQFGHKTIPPPGKYVLTVFASVAVRHDSKSWTEPLTKIWIYIPCRFVNPLLWRTINFWWKSLSMVIENWNIPNLKIFFEFHMARV